MHVADAEKDELAPALRRACALLVHWSQTSTHRRDMAGVACILAELRTVGEAKDTMLAMLLAGDEPPSRLPGLAESTAARERL